MDDNSFSFDNIDLYYYHAIDLDFTRLFSIMKYGITSASKAKKLNLPYFHRNYKKASCKEDYISVSHFPRTFFQFYKLKNELYDSSSHKIVFILDDIKVLEKTSHAKKVGYTNERHIYSQILLNQIKGIAVRDCDATKDLKEIGFKLSYAYEDGQLKKCFDTIKFFQNEYGYFQENNLKYLIGSLIEEKMYSDDYLHSDIYKDIKRQIEELMCSYVNEAYKHILNKDTLTVMDIISFYNVYQMPIYLLSSKDIKLEDGSSTAKQPLMETRMDTVTRLKSDESSKRYRLEQKYLPMMSAVGQGIYYGYDLGPMTIEDNDIRLLLESEVGKIKTYKRN